MLKLKTDLGYLKGFSDLQRGKINIQLEKLVRYKNIIHDYKNYIAIRIIEGFNIPKVEENYTYYKKDGEKSKPKTLYMLTHKEGTYIELNKTLYSFAKWLIENGLITEEKIIEVDNMECLRLEKIKQEEERIRLEEEQKENELKRIKENFETELEEKIKNYNNTDRLALAERIHLDILGEYYTRSARMILVIIENFDNDLYREKAKSILHLDNKASRKIFECVTGITLPKTLKETMNILDNITSKDFADMKEFKSRKKYEKKEINLEKFYVRIGADGTKLAIVEGEKINHLGLGLFINHNTDGYSITEVTTGLQLIGKDTNKQRLIKSLKERVTEDNIGRIKELIQNTINRLGELPRVS